MSSISNIRQFVQNGRKIVAVGRNYRDHCAELNNSVPTTPMLFMKPPSAYLQEGQGPILIPRGCQSLHHEVELAVVIGSVCRDVTEAAVMSHVAGYALTLDMTARDIQEKCKSKGHPWEIAKGFDTSLPVSRFIELQELPDPHAVTLWCQVNGEHRQRGSTDQMVFNIPTLLSFISSTFTLYPGDVVLTGTPAGVGPVTSGDTITCGLDVGGDEQTLLKCNFVVAQR